MAPSHPDEPFDVVDDDDRALRVMRRADVHKNALNHRAVSILIFGADGRLLLQRRSLSKDEHPGTWTASASGHVESDETYDTTAPREVQEELGIESPPLERLGKLAASAETAYEFTVVYAGRHDGPFQPEAAEVTEIKWVSPVEFQQMVDQPGVLAPPFRSVAQAILVHTPGGDLLEGARRALQTRQGRGGDVDHFDLIIEGGTLMTPSGRLRTDVGVRGGTIAEIGELSGALADERIDARGLFVLPGAIDTQVHFREPGLVHKEDIGTGSAGAILGGVTAFLEMPNTRPSTTTAELLDWKVARAATTSHADFGFFVGAAAENVGVLGELERRPGCAGVKVFMGSSTGSLLVDDPVLLEAVLRGGRRRVAVHAEDEARLQERKPLAATNAPTTHPEWRDATTAALATGRLLALAERVGRLVHVLHVTSADELPILAAHKGIATCEVTPQHLTLAAPECYERLGTYAQMNPPIRSAEHRAALWRAVRSGLFDVIGSDHAPHSREEKALPYPQSPSGMPGVQTLLPLMLDHVHAGRLTLERLVDLVSAGPARIYGMRRKGRLVLGNDADLVLVDLERRHTFTNAEMATRCGWTPFAGETVTGFPVMTVLRGRVVMRDGQIIGPPTGRAVEF